MTAKEELAELYTKLEEALLKLRDAEGSSDFPAAAIHAYYQLQRNLIKTMTEEQAGSHLEGLRRLLEDARAGRVKFSDVHSDGNEPNTGGGDPGNGLGGDEGASDAGVRDLTDKLIDILNRPNSPLRTIWDMVKDRSVDWSSDTKNWKKGYVMACFSELVYLQMSRYEVPKRDRYKVIPSSALRLLVEHSIQIDVGRLTRRITDIPSATADAGQLVIGVFVFPEFTIVAVRGTIPWLNDVLVDLDEKRLTVGDLMYHHGFYTEATGALKDVAKRAPAELPIYFTGHSLGGALATLLPSIWPGPQRLMTPYVFASPRVGNKKVADATKAYSHVRAADVVPHMPPRASGFYNSGWPVTVIPTGDTWLEGREIAAKTGLHPFKALSAHRMEQYRKLMAKEAGAPPYAANVYYKRLKKLLAD